MSDSSTAAPQPFRVLPAVDDVNRHFWVDGRGEHLLVLRCQDCGEWIHPPTPRCPACLAKNIAPEAVSGRAEVVTFTVNHQPWFPTLDPPYVVAIVELAEQVGLRLTTNIFNCPPDAVSIGMAVTVVFEQYEEVFLPMFEPADPADRIPGAHLGPAPETD